MAEKNLTPPRGEPTFQRIARRLPNSPRSASSYFSICTKMVQFVFPPDRTVNHKFSAAPFHFRDPLLNSVEKTLHPTRTFDGDMHQNVACPLKIFLRAKNVSRFFLILHECHQTRQNGRV